MNNERFEQECTKLLDDATKNIMKKKGREYAGNQDRLANFKRGSANVGVNPETVLWIYCSKHIDSLSTFVKDLEEYGRSCKMPYSEAADKLSEPIQERLKDCINYLLLLNGLIVERMETECGKSGCRGVEK